MSFAVLLIATFIGLFLSLILTIRLLIKSSADMMRKDGPSTSLPLQNKFANRNSDDLQDELSEVCERQEKYRSKVFYCLKGTARIYDKIEVRYVSVNGFKCMGFHPRICDFKSEADALLALELAQELNHHMKWEIVKCSYGALYEL